MSLPGVVSRDIDHYQRFMDGLLTEGLGIESLLHVRRDEGREGAR